MKSIEFFFNRTSRNESIIKSPLDIVSEKKIKEVRSFHSKFDQYLTTPLRELDKLANFLGLKNIWVKDESLRFGLNAFKVLGGSYAIGYCISKELDIPLSDLTFNQIKSVKLRKKLGEKLFVTATDGNHGRGIAWAARKIGQKAVIFMPKGSSSSRIENIKKEGAQVVVTDLNYDDTVKIASEFAYENNGILTQDTAWNGYEEIPTWIMQGYFTLIDEVFEQLKNQNKENPSHIFLQAGVGSLAASVQAYLVENFGNARPVIGIIEPHDAACIYESVKVSDGNLHSKTGNLNTMMAGLACGTPNFLALHILRDYSDIFFSVSDSLSAKGMRILANPLRGDPRVISGESGAVGMGLLYEILRNDLYIGLKKELGLDQNSKILLLSTEGDTDPKNYLKIVWEGANTHYP